MKESLRINYLHQYFIPPSGSGGTRSYEFARRLIDMGHEVHMITSSAYLPAEYQKMGAGIFQTEISGIPATIIPVPYSTAEKYIDRIKAFVYFAIQASKIAMKHPADVIFATSTPLTIAIPAIAGKLWQRIPMVFEVRDLWPELPIAIGAIRNPILVYIARKLERVAYKNSEHIVALSPGMKDGVVQSGFPQKRVHIIPNSCDMELFKVPAGAECEFRARYPWLGERPLIIYAGTLGIINGVGYLAHVAKEMLEINSDVRFLVLGRGFEWESINKLAGEIGVLNKNFFMESHIPKAQMPSALAAADIATSLFIDLPEMRHNSANKFFDGLASGTPMAINYEGWQADLLKETGAGVIMNPVDHKLAAATLNNLLQNPSTLEATGIAARELASKRFDRDTLAQQLEKVIQSAAST